MIVRDEDCRRCCAGLFDGITDIGKDGLPKVSGAGFFRIGAANNLGAYQWLERVALELVEERRLPYSMACSA